MTRISVDRQAIQTNRTFVNGEEKIPPIVVRHNDGSFTRHTELVVSVNPNPEDMTSIPVMRIVYCPDSPLEDGTEVWIELEQQEPDA